MARKMAVITGAASGVGKATAPVFIKNGAKVVLADIRDDVGRAVATDLGPRASYTRCEVKDEAQLAAIVELRGHLYFNAGVDQRVDDAPDMEEFDRVMATNARATVAAVKHGARQRLHPEHGQRGGVMPHVYSVSKTAVLGLVRSVAGELRSWRATACG
ncbi:hypothetical protein EJB05_10674, partial [Eragrostis curvula]